MTPEELAQLRRACDLRHREYARPLDVRAMANAAPRSPSHFSRQFGAAYGKTPSRTARSARRASSASPRGDAEVGGAR